MLIQLESSSHLLPSLVCFQCESQMNMVAEIRLNFLRVAEFWKQHTDRTCVNAIELEKTVLSASTPFEVALIKCETESQCSSIDDNRPSTSQQDVEENIIEDSMLSPSKSKGRGRPSEILPFESFECEICGKITKTK